MKRSFVIFLCLSLLCLPFVGCIMKLDGNGEYGFKQESTMSFYHSTEIADPKQTATIEIASQPFLDWIATDTVPASEGQDD